MEFDLDFGLGPFLVSQGLGDILRLSPIMTAKEGAPTHTEDGIPIRKLFVANLPQNTTRTELNILFSKFGEIKGTWVHSGKLRGGAAGRQSRQHYAFVTFVKHQDAHKALEVKANMTDLRLRGRKLRVSPADSWHQPVEDESGVMLWKTSLRHYQQSKIDVENIPDTDDAKMSGVDGSATILDILNHYCLNAVLGYLPFRDLVRSELVCKRWRENVQHMYTTIHTFSTDDWCIRHSEITTAVLRNLLTKVGPYLRTLEVNGNLGIYNERTSIIIGKYCPNLINLKLSSMKISNWLPLIKRCKLLESIAFSNCDKLTDESLTSLFKQEDCKLRSLNVSSSSNLTGSFLMSAPQDKGLSALMLNACFHLQGHFLLSGLRAMPTITHLQLDVCTRKVLRFIPEVLKCLTALSRLEVSEVGAFSAPTSDETLAADLDEALACLPHMQRLRLRWYLVTDKTLFVIAAKMPKLTFLDVAGCNGYDKMNETKQSGVTDRGIQKLIRSCVSLRTLDISYLADVTVDAVHALAGLPHLAALHLRGNRNISDAGYISVLKSCHELELLEVCGGELVTSDIISAASQALGNRPPHLCKPLRLALSDTNALVPDGDLPKDLHPLLQIDTEEPADRQRDPYHLLSPSDGISDDDSYDFDISDDDYEDYYEHRFGLGPESDEYDADILEQLDWGLYPE